MSFNPNRRMFLQTATIGAAASLRAMGANDRVNVAVVGLGGRGRNHMTEYAKLPDARIAALCDVDQAALERGEAVVALESTVISHGLPYPQNHEVAQRLEAVVRAAGAVPATKPS